MQKTIISWTNVTWNPTFGCSVVSEGCRFCYAQTIALKFGQSKKPWTGANAAENVQLKPHKLREPYKLKEPSRIFVNSMSDLFHEQIPDAYIEKVFDVMNELPQHIFQVLTKRPERAAEWTYGWASNIWMGTSVEDRRAVHRIETLKQCEARVLFISAEPLLGPLGDLDLSGIHWLIVGGESGIHMKPNSPRWMQQDWARDLKRQCIEQSVAYFYKQDSGQRTEMRPYLVEEDGSRWQWMQFPGDLRPPVNLDAPESALVESPQQLTLF